ncbi:MAG: uracil-DNA glycosylase [Oscillospiraceae bacterium]|nr:uracil-DNA glycosylase [Oscillospiraceae bacterium]
MENPSNPLNPSDEWEKLYEQCANCELCELHKTKTKVVFGKGSQQAKIMFVGEAPGEYEDREGLPFVGRAGKLLDLYMSYVDLSLENVYIANILKCRPPQNRDPDPAEQERCIGYLRLQTKLLNPQIIVCLGRIAAMRIIKPDFKITAEHGIWEKKGDIYMTAIYHPAALLRDPAKKAEALLDFKSVQKKAAELGIL